MGKLINLTDSKHHMSEKKFSLRIFAPSSKDFIP